MRHVQRAVPRVCVAQKRDDQADAAERERAATKIQATCRRYRARKVVRGMRQHKAAVKLHAAARGYLARCRVTRIRSPPAAALYHSG